MFFTWFVGGVNIGDGDSMGVQPGDVGKVIALRVTVIKAGYSDGIAFSANTDAVVVGTQSFTPAIVGATAVGSTLSVTGLATDATSTYQWKRNGVSISTAKASTYKLSSLDLGKKLSVTVTATRDGYTTLSKTSASTATVTKAFSKSYAPRITGTAKVGYTLKATTTAWSPTASLKYQWYRDGAAISGATTTSRKLSSSDEGKQITVKVTGSKSGYYTLSKTSTATTVVGKGSIVAATPKITGTAKAGYTLTVTPGTPSPSTAHKTYQWYRSGVAVAGATATTYVLHNVDAYRKITVAVTYTLTGYTTKVVTSAATATIAKRTASMVSGSAYAPGFVSPNHVSPGVYFTDSATDTCAWERVVYGSWALIVGFTDANARWMVQISDGEAFYSEGCGSWYKYDGTGAMATTITKTGLYAVNADVMPGTWRVDGTPDSCTITFETDASQEPYAVADEFYPVGGDTFTISASDPYVGMWGCGSLTRISD